jgi:hypothetical protein
MALHAIERESERVYDPANSGTGKRVWGVFEATDEDEALTATELPAANSGWGSSALLAKAPYVSGRVSPGYYLVTVEYSIPRNGEQVVLLANPRNQPLELEMDVQQISEPSDIDLDRYPVVNSAGDIASGHQKVVTLIILTAYKYHSNFNLDWIDQYANSVSDSPTNLFDVSWPARHFYCKWIKLDGRHKVNAPYVHVAGQFYAISEDELGPNPFQTRLMDAGVNGWYTGPTAGKLVMRGATGGWEPVGEPQKLDGTGKPRNSSVRVADGQTAIAYAGSGYSPMQTEVNADATWNYWKKAKVVDQSGLASIFF